MLFFFFLLSHLCYSTSTVQYIALFVASFWLYTIAAQLKKYTLSVKSRFKSILSFWHCFYYRPMIFRVSFVYHFTEKCDQIIIPHNRTVMYNFHSNCFDEIVNNRLSEDYLINLALVGFYYRSIVFRMSYFCGFYIRIGTENSTLQYQNRMSIFSYIIVNKRYFRKLLTCTKTSKLIESFLIN